MRAHLSPAWLGSILLLGCLSSSDPVTLRDGERAHRITCNYTLDNCHAEARAICSGRYDVIRGGNASCADCGMSGIGDQRSPEVDPMPPAQSNQSSVFKGVLYVRCK